MRSRRLTPPVRRTARRWRTPPAILHGGEAFEGAAVLDEMPGPLGVLLFQVARDVYLWAGTPPEEREGLFQPRADTALAEMLREADADVQLELAVMPLVRMADAPELAQEEQVAVACQHVARWADVNGHLETAIAFAQGAAVVLPTDAAASFAVGRLARRRAEYARAETWYRRAVALGRQSGDWASYSMAFGGLGNLYAQRGNLPVARRFHLRALRSARRHSLRALHGSALHDLFVLAAQMGQPDAAESLARQAFDMYGTDHPRLVFLAADVAYLWMERGRFAPALAVFQALVHHLRRHEDLITQANMVRAAAGAGERRLFEQTFEEVWDRVARTQNLENAAAVMLELARGATMLGEWERAERAAERAAQIARERAEGKVLLSAEAVLDQVRRNRGVRARAAAAAPPPEPETAARAQTFAQDLVRTLNAVLVSR
jgi:tetratricopeptide (TPR) repeat protein